MGGPRKPKWSNFEPPRIPPTGFLAAIQDQVPSHREPMAPVVHFSPHVMMVRPSLWASDRTAICMCNCPNCHTPNLGWCICPACQCLNVDECERLREIGIKVLEARKR